VGGYNTASAGERVLAEAVLKAVLINVLLVGSGGFVGAILRYGLSGAVHRKLSLETFPYGTLAVNLVGCLLIGAAMGLAESRQLFGPEFRRWVLIGLLGSFTTFSTFGYESFALMRDAEYMRAFVNVGVHVLLGLALVWAGYSLTMSR
jgi:CrcB protein